MTIPSLILIRLWKNLQDRLLKLNITLMIKNSPNGYIKLSIF